MTFKKQLHKANSDGSLGVIVPADTTGPNGEDIEVGDVVTFRIVRVEKQSNE